MNSTTIQQSETTNNAILQPTVFPSFDDWVLWVSANAIQLVKAAAVYLDTLQDSTTLSQHFIRPRYIRPELPTKQQPHLVSLLVSKANFERVFQHDGDRPSDWYDVLSLIKRRIETTIDTESVAKNYSKIVQMGYLFTPLPDGRQKNEGSLIIRLWPKRPATPGAHKT